MKTPLPEQDFQVESIPICTKCFAHALRTRDSLGQMDLTVKVAIVEAQLVIDMEKCEESAYCFGENGLPLEVQMRRRFNK